ncbi:MAG: zinc ABC transporter ATP-binding protein ZnuC [Alphaproteobacteria bacterium]|nr:zinc ABC transporter ATP-binding protein ZnuC [Alphaproteobacteria bacterium]
MTTLPAAGGPLLRLDGIDLDLGRRAVLRDIDLNVSPGEIVTLIGPNGAGKTSLVRVALSLVVPTRGTVVRRAGLRIGYMPQRLAIDPTLPLTVRRFMAVGGAHPRAVAGPLAEVGAAGLEGAPVQGLSGGELQRVMLARALSREPDLLVLDEPAQGVDVQGQVELFDLIARVRRERGCAVLLVSHDLHLVMAATDMVVCLNHHVCCTGHPEAVSRHPAYLALLGPTARGLAVYAHSHDHRHDVAGAVVDGYDHDDRHGSHRHHGPA